jgi:hypothetical protein
MPPFLTDGWQGVVLSAITFSAVAWLFFFFVRFWFVVPYLVVKSLEDRLAVVDALSQPRIDVSWRIGSGRFAELILTNQSTMSIKRIEVSFRNYRKADGTGITDVIRSMKSVDGRGPSITLDPLVQTFFRFAEPTGPNYINAQIILTPSDTDAIYVNEREIGVKFTVAGEDIVAQTIEFRLKLSEDYNLVLEPWQSDKKVVNIAEPNE